MLVYPGLGGSLGIQSYLLKQVRLDPPNLHNNVSNHLLTRYLDP